MERYARARARDQDAVTSLALLTINRQTTPSDMRQGSRNVPGSFTRPPVADRLRGDEILAPEPGRSSVLADDALKFIAVYAEEVGDLPTVRIWSFFRTRLGVLCDASHRPAYHLTI